MTSAASPVVAVVGPTAVGKTRLAIALAQRFGGEIVNADSRQVYRLMSIGTAKPTPAERAEAPHHLVDILNPDENFGLGLFLKLAHEAIGDITARGRLPIVAGGTGQYVWGLLEGRQVPQVAAGYPVSGNGLSGLQSKEVATRCTRGCGKSTRTGPPSWTLAMSAGLSAPWKSIMQPGGNRRKLTQDQAPPFPSLVIGLTMERQELYRRIDARVDDMMAQGLLDEVERIGRGGVPVPGQGCVGQPGLP